MTTTAGLTNASKRPKGESVKVKDRLQGTVQSKGGSESTKGKREK